MSDPALTPWPARVYSGSGMGEKSETLAVEEPLELRLHTPSGPVTLGVLMRTPGADAELVRGWLLSEGLWPTGLELQADPENPNVMGLHTPEFERLAAWARPGVSSSACGVCGTGSIERLAVRAALPVWTGGSLILNCDDSRESSERSEQQKGRAGGDGRTSGVVTDVRESEQVRISAAFLAGLPGRLQALQPGFAASGGLHAAGLFGPDGVCLCAYEDIGRHNATDKVMGWALERELLPLSDSILVVSSRAGFEIVQKAVTGGVAVVVTVGAATSLAAETAATFGLTLCGWARADRLTVYSGAARVGP
ncbi:formate dehydrogenase accessory sulfurtransferase FdhD [Deinococcus sp. QL22]|uniref:formate dehydrogenase accessory sulfurtransferase FdhD n=1 Tax=Deinococcus sp. QL22 TaxID=2939437 RepID=UPI002017EFD5|nr:formate dehydrogenase accessory sulfurtransferase FdhD [Deinococcus sp. QL22]UQN05591.1 formate dehydrogenase accessory sulfurtransferase FdhD [Deinococcus sp. QL22]